MAKVDCEPIPDIKINGNNYGGYLYDLKIDVGFNSPTVFMASFVSKDGTYLIDENSLNAETPTQLNIAGKVFHIYAVNYKIQQSGSGKLLVVKFLDSSHKFLDKFNVTTDLVKNSPRYLPIIPTSVKETGDIELGKYVPAELREAMAGKIPMEEKVINLLNSFKRIVPKRKENEVQNVSGLYLDTMGTLRDVLNTLGTQVGQIFFWDWSSGGDGRLDMADSVSGASAKAFAASLKSTYGKYISNYDESYSIEDNFADGDLVYDITSYGQAGQETIRLPSTKIVNFKYVDIMRAYFWVKPNPETREYFTPNELDNKNWFKLCAAAMMGEDFFNDYIDWNIAAEAASKAAANPNNFANLMGRDGKLEDKSGNLKALDEEYNPYIKKYLGKYYEASLIFAKEKGLSIADLCKFMEDNGMPARAGIVKSLAASIKDKSDIAEIRKKYPSPKVYPFWAVKIKKYNPKKTEDEEDNFPDKVKPGFKELVHELWTTCELFGRHFQRHYLSTNKMGFTKTFTYEPTTIGKGDYESYKMEPDEWIYENGDACQTFFADFISYNRIPHFKDELNPKLADNKPAFREFFDHFSIAVKDGEPEPEVPDITEAHRLNLRGYVHFDRAKERKVSVPNSMAIAHLEESNFKLLTSYASLIEDEATIYLAQPLSTIERDLGVAINIFGVDSDNKKLDPYIRRSYNKTRDVVSNSMTRQNWDAWYSAQNQAHKWTVANTMTITKVPEVSEYYKFGTREWLDKIKQIKWQEPVPAISYNLTIEKLIPMGTGWLNSGMESYSISYNGSSGVTTSITIGTRKKQRQALENQERMIRIAAGNGLNFTKVYMLRPSAARGSISYGMKAFS